MVLLNVVAAVHVHDVPEVADAANAVMFDFYALFRSIDDSQTDGGNGSSQDREKRAAGEMPQQLFGENKSKRNENIENSFHNNFSI